MGKLINYLTANSVHKLFRKLPSSIIHRLARQVNKAAVLNGLTYTDDQGKTTVITLTLRPRLLDSKAERFLWQTILTLDQSFQKVASLYFKVPGLYELFPFSGRERNWISLIEERSYLPGRLATRWDANTTFAHSDWKGGFSFFEVNGVGVGGMWYGPAAGELALKIIVPELRKLDPNFKPSSCQNMSFLLLDLITRQRKKINRTHGAIAFVMQKAEGSNFIEFERLAKLYQKEGFAAIVIEPTDLELKKGEVFARGKKIDMVYRDTTLSELCDLEERGYDLTAFREAFRRGQVISSLEGEFDHKSAFEVFTNSEYAKFFTQKERELFKRYILWTRLLTERKTTAPNGKTVELISFVRKNQSDLVLKPNRLYGGKGIVFGRETSKKNWEKKIDAALKESGDWVIQKLGAFKTKSFFSRMDRKVSEHEYYVVSGFFATEKGLGIVGRMSENKIVNVAQRGGLTPILLIK